MKSYCDMFSELYHALAKDVCAQYRSIQQEIERDLVRLQSALRKEGLPFLTITQPAMCDFFQKSLCSGTLDDLHLPSRPRGLGRRSLSDRRPKYLWSLWSLVFSADGKLLPDPDVTAIAFVRQWLLMAKKLEVDCDESRTEATLTEFLAIDARLPDHHPGTWDLDDPIWARREGHPLWGRPDQTHPSLFGEMNEDEGIDWDQFRDLSDRFRSMIGTFDPWLARPKHGPGAVADPNQPMKYDFTSWPRKLQQFFPWDFFASHDFGLTQIEQGREPDSREHPSVVLCVPKTQKGPRIICKEPIAHMWMQGAIERFLIQRMRDTPIGLSINIKDQTLSQEAALDASLDGSLSTVDLSSASDRISTRLVEYIFGGGSDTSLLDALHACRSRYFVLNGTHKFRKFAPAGSACTFPVQSLVFTVIALSAVMQSRQLSMSNWLSALHLVRVYGDDIIVPTDSIPMLYKMLHSCGLKVNERKSYSEGLFRESCGMDAYAGEDVTPAYVRHLYSPSRPSSLQAVVDTSNNLFLRGYWNTAARLLKTVPEKEQKLLPVGYQDGGAVSLYSFCGTYTSHLSSRFNESTHRIEYSSMVLRTHAKRRQSDGAAGLIQFFNEEPDPLTPYASGEALRPVTTKSRRWV